VVLSYDVLRGAGDPSCTLRDTVQTDDHG
jgi:hypothetical protein